MFDTETYFSENKVHQGFMCLKLAYALPYNQLKAANLVGRYIRLLNSHLPCQSVL